MSKKKKINLLKDRSLIFKCLFPLIFVIFFLFNFVSYASVQKTFNIVDFGAKPGEVVTQEIQMAVDSCSHSGGGTVLIPSDTFHIGTVILKSNVTIHLEAGAVLKGSSDTTDYMKIDHRYGMFLAKNARNITIKGEGTIDGNGTHFMNQNEMHASQWFKRKYTRQGEEYAPEFTEDGPIAYDYRPGFCLVFVNCENIKLLNFVLRDTPNWATRFGASKDIIIRGVTIDNNLLIPNSDGIHCTTSRNVRISDCNISGGDDAIAITGFTNTTNVHGEKEGKKDISKYGNKSSTGGNITVANCVLESRSTAVRVGYGDNDVRNCVFSNLIIKGSNRGLSIFTRDSGNVHNIMFSNIYIETRIHSGIWWGNGEPIHISALAQDLKVPVGNISDVKFQNITAYSETGMVIYGKKKGIIKNISFDNITLHLQDGKYVDDYGGNFDLRPTADLQDGVFEHDIPGLYLQNAENFNLTDFEIFFDPKLPEYYRYGLQIKNSENVMINRFSMNASKKQRYPAISLSNVSDGEIITYGVHSDENHIYIEESECKNINKFNL